MAQLTIYIDDDTLKRIEQSARKGKESVSGWVKKKLVTSLDSGWPAHYFELFGSLKNVPLERPKQLFFDKDVKRAEL